MQKAQTYHYKHVAVSYKKTGRGRPLLILHGWGSSGKIMMPLAQQLSDVRTCYVLDLPGFGESPAPDRPWNVTDYANLIQQFIHDQKLAPADILAHSFGGRITLKLSARPGSKELLDKVLITGGAGMKPRRSFAYFVRKYTAKVLKAPFYLLPDGPRQKALAGLRQTKLWKSLGSTDYRKLEGVMRETFVLVVSEYLESSLPKITQDVLLLWGKNDEAAPLYQAERMEQGIEHAALVVIDYAGHYAFLDQPSRFTSVARAFFEG